MGSGSGGAAGAGVRHEELYSRPGRRCGQYLFVKRVLYEEATKWQRIEVVEAEVWGETLLLDGIVQTAHGDHEIYHESMVHAAMHWYRRAANSWPSVVGIIGGGDGGVLREVVRYPVQRIIMREIDERVVWAARTYLPRVSAGAFEDQRLDGSVIGDGVHFLRASRAGSLDLLIVDSTDPIGPAAKLFGAEFHRQASRVLSRHGVYVQQTGSVALQRDELAGAVRSLRRSFRSVIGCFPAIPLYYGGLFSICIASKTGEATPPVELVTKIEDQLAYLTSERMRADLKPPRFLRQLFR